MRKYAMREPDEDDSEFDESDSSAADDDSDEEEPHSQQDSPPPSPRRSSAPSGGAARGNKGLLRGLLDLPLDVLAGICEHLDLETLFHVSRLNKRFYKFLRGTEALSYLWDWAREESGLPELTAPGFSTVQLANLLFSKYCQNCARTTPKVDFLLRVRLCQACSNYLIYDDRHDDFRLTPYMKSALCPAGTREGSGRTRNHTEYLLADLDFTADFTVHWIDMGAGYDPAVTVEKGEGFIERGDYTYEAFAKRCREVSQLRKLDGDAIIVWQQLRVVKQVETRQARRAQRRKAIEERLNERGWQFHHFDSNDWQTHSLVNTVRVLNDKTWRKIRGKLELFLQAHEAERDAAHILVVRDGRRFEVEQEHAGLVADGALAKSLGLYPLPTWSEFSVLPVVAKLWHVATIDEAYEDDYPTIATEAANIAKELSKLQSDCKSDLVAHFVAVFSSLNKVPQAIQPLLTPVDPAGFNVDEEDKIVGLACCAVWCSTCSLVDVFPRILAHECERGVLGHDRAATWVLRGYAADEPSVLAALSVVAAAQLEPDAHYSQLDALGSTFTCLCDKGDAVAVPWQNMVYHVNMLHALKDDPEPDVVAESEQEALERVFKIHEKGLRWAGMRGEDAA